MFDEDHDVDCASATDAEDLDEFDDGEDDEVEGDDSDLDAFDELAVEDNEDDDLDALDARRRRQGRGRRQRRRRNAPCSCPQCLMDQEMGDEDSDADVDDDDFDDAEDDEDDVDDEDADDDSDLDGRPDELAVEDNEDDDLDALDERRRRQGRSRRRRRRRNAPCGCPQCLMDDELTDEEGDADCASADETDELGDDELDDADDEGDDNELEEADDESDDDEDDFDDDEGDYDEALEDEDALDGNGFELFEDAAGDLDDEQDAREPVFKGFFADRDKQNIRAALRIAQTLASRAKSVFDRIMRSKGRRRVSAYRRTPFVERFFGRRFVTSGEIRRIRRRVRKIERILRKRRIRFNRAFADAPRCRSGSSAFTTAAGGIRRLYVCPTFLARAPSDMARTIIHELVHEIGFCHYSTTGRIRCTRAGARTEGEAAILAAQHPTKARKNPQNYVWLFDRLERNRIT